MASNSQALQSLSDERRAVTDTPVAGRWPAGGNPVPESQTSVGTVRTGDVPTDSVTGAEPSAEGDEPIAIPVPDVSKTVKRGTAPKSAPTQV